MVNFGFERAKDLVNTELQPPDPQLSDLSAQFVNLNALLTDLVEADLEISPELAQQFLERLITGTVAGANEIYRLSGFDLPTDLNLDLNQLLHRIRNSSELVIRDVYQVLIGLGYSPELALSHAYRVGPKPVFFAELVLALMTPLVEHYGFQAPPSSDDMLLRLASLMYLVDQHLDGQSGGHADTVVMQQLSIVREELVHDTKFLRDKFRTIVRKVVTGKRYNSQDIFEVMMHPYLDFLVTNGVPESALIAVVDGTADVLTGQFVCSMDPQQIDQIKFYQDLVAKGLSFGSEQSNVPLGLLKNILAAGDVGLVGVALFLCANGVAQGWVDLRAGHPLEHITNIPEIAAATALLNNSTRLSDDFHDRLEDEERGAYNVVTSFIDAFKTLPREEAIAQVHLFYHNYGLGYPESLIALAIELVEMIITNGDEVQGTAEFIEKLATYNLEAYSFGVQVMTRGFSGFSKEMNSITRNTFVVGISILLTALGALFNGWSTDVVMEKIATLLATQIES